MATSDAGRPARRAGFFFYLVNLPRWGLEARRRLRSGDLAKDSPKPESSGRQPDDEGLIWTAATHPVAYWSLVVFGYVLLVAFIAFAVLLLVSLFT